MIRAAALALVLLPLGPAAQAQGAPGLAFTLGAGVEAVPGYFGSDEAEPGVALEFDLGYLSVGPLSFGDPDLDAVREGFGVRGSFRYVPERSSDEFEELAGTNDVDAAFELGGGVRYARPWFEAFAVARYGVTGHDSLVGEAGVDFIARPSDRLALRAGPRVLVGSDDYAATYFGVTDGEAASSAFSAFEAEGGLLSSGIEVGADYRLTDEWGLAATARYDRLRGDAAESPITAEDSQFSGSLLVTRRFAFEF